ncbi:MAG: toxin glutamine deamidase domain-containing protein [Oscillospiraceae bacterium]
MEFKANCQRCVPAFEARIRGFDVIAKPSLENDTLGFSEYRKIFVDMQWIKCPNGSGIEDIKKYMQQWGNGARAEISIKTTDGSHLFIAEQHDNKTYFKDPQNGSLNGENYFNKKLIDITEISRIDNLNFSELIRDCIEEVVIL